MNENFESLIEKVSQLRLRSGVGNDDTRLEKDGSMVANIASLMSRILQTSQSTALKPAIAPKSDNPFASPFISTSGNTNYMTYGKNQPIQGGFFAGYYNGKPNIVGRQLFVEA